MSNNPDTAYPDFFRRRTLGRAPSPPTWACYEQIPYDDDYSDSESDNNSCSEDDEDYDHAASDGERPGAVNESLPPSADGDMELDEGDEPMPSDKVAELKKDIKGKQRAIESHYESPKREHRKKHRQPVFTLRPILTIQKSQGFVWNQVRPSSVAIVSRSGAQQHSSRTSSSRHTSKTDVRSALSLLFVSYSR